MIALLSYIAWYGIIGIKKLDSLFESIIIVVVVYWMSIYLSGIYTDASILIVDRGVLVQHVRKGGVQTAVAQTVLSVKHP